MKYVAFFLVVLSSRMVWSSADRIIERHGDSPFATIFLLRFLALAILLLGAFAVDQFRREAKMRRNSVRRRR